MSTESDSQKYKKEIAGVFSRTASTYGQVGPPFFDYFAEKLIDFIDISVGATVLDIATGTGAALRAAGSATGRTGTVVGVDISPDMVLRAKEIAAFDGVANVNFCVMDGEKLGFSGESFDVVLCAMSMMFFPDVSKVIEQVTTLLRRPGKIGISTFGGQDDVSKRIVELARDYGVSKRLIWTPLRTEKEHRELLGRFGFEEIRTTSEEADFVYADRDEWWAMNWSAGLRGVLEEIAERRREEFKADAFSCLGEYARDDGIHHPRNALYTNASWSGT